MRRFACFALTILAFTCAIGSVRAQEGPENPVGLEFEPDAARIDMVTGTTVPAVSFAVRGSIEFYSGRLDSPEDFVRYYHDGPRTVPAANLRSMEKFKRSHSQWRLRMTTRRDSPQYIPRVYSLAVSFVPADEQGQPAGGRVHLPLDDLRLIEWEKGGGDD